MNRRSFLRRAAIGAAASPAILHAEERSEKSLQGQPREYGGPNVIVIRFGGGVRRKETIDETTSYAPYFLKELVPRGVLFNQMTISQMEHVETGHGQGTLNILTGIYDRYQDVGGKFLGQRFEAKVPTLFEYLRKTYNLPAEQTLIINGEDRTDEEFYSFSNHHLFGVEYRSHVLSLYRFKVHLLRRKLEDGKGSEKELEKTRSELEKLVALDYRTVGRIQSSKPIERFWDGWRAHYGDSGFVNARGDRLLTDLALRAMKELRPRLMMVNYNDPDYVHWGYMNHYTRGVAVIDEGIRRLVTESEVNEAYRNQTVFVIVPDCGRDNTPFAAVPCQHHFNSKSAREIFAFFMGPGVDSGRIVDRPMDQIAVAATVGGLMGFRTPHAAAGALTEVFV